MRSAPRASRQRGRERRKAILDAAIDLFAEGGFRGTGLAAVGSRAGVTHSAVLYHFGSATKLLLAVLEERDRRAGRELARIFSSGGLDALRRLPEVARFNERNAGLAKLYTVLEAENLDPESAAHRYFRDRARKVRRLLARVLREAQRSGEIRSDVDPRAKADEIVAFMEGAQILRFLDPKTLRLESLYEHYAESLVRDLALRSSER